MKMKRIIIGLIMCTFLLSGCAGKTAESSDVGAASTSATNNSESTSAESVNDTEAEPTEPAQEETEKQEEKKEYHIGETWTVEGQWSLTINSITETDYRNEFSDTTPNHVYMIEYSYENLGYVDDWEIMDGVYFDLESEQIVDGDGLMGNAYPGDVTKYPQETPVNARCNAQACIGVDNAGTITIYVEKYDGNSVEQKATFVLEP